MNYWESDVYLSFKSFVDKEKSIDDRLSVSTLGDSALSRIARIANNEGVTIGRQDKDSFCENVHSSIYCYEPIDLKIWIDESLPWPQFRWYAAVGLGHHFTRHHYFERSSKDEWRKAAEAWATAFLASHAVVRSEGPLPSNARPSAPVKDESKSSSTSPTPRDSATKQWGAAPRNKMARRPHRCRGIKPDGSSCCIRGLGDSGFCKYHQGQGTSLASMALTIARLATETDPGGG